MALGRLNPTESKALCLFLLESMSANERGLSFDFFTVGYPILVERAAAHGLDQLQGIGRVYQTIESWKKILGGMTERLSKRNLENQVSTWVDDPLLGNKKNVGDLV